MNESTDTMERLIAEGVRKRPLRRRLWGPGVDLAFLSLLSLLFVLVLVAL